MDTGKFFDPVDWRRQPNLVPKSTYTLPTRDRDLPDDVQEWLRCHPLIYDLGGHDGRFARCPTCEQWTTGGGCEVRELAESGDLEAARRLHNEREWPAGTGKATTTFRGMRPDYRLVTFEYVEAES